MTTPKSKFQRVLIFAIGILTVPISLAAQDPFGDPFGAAATTASAPAAGSGGQAAPPANEEVDPLVNAIISAQATEPGDLLRSIEILMDYGRLDVAKTLLDQLNGLTLTPEQQVELHTRFRSALFLRIAQEPQLQPAGASLAKNVMEATRLAARDRDRVTALIGQLSDPEPARRHTAVVDLRAAQDAGVNGLLQVLADANQASEHRTVRDALVAVLTPPAEVQLRNATLPLTEIVVSAATTADPAFQVQVMAVLGRLAAREATPLLVRPALAADSPEAVQRVAQRALLNIVGALPTQHEAEIYLERRARRYLEDQRAAAHLNQSLTAVWQWDDATKEATLRQIDLEQAALLKARRMTRELHLLNRENVPFRNLYLATALQADKMLGGLATPLTQEAGSAFAQLAAEGLATATEVFEFALNNDQIAGAIGAVEVLGQVGEPAMLVTPDGNPGRLTQMLLHENRRMRFAAAQTILKLDPQGPYPGSSYLTEALAYFASTAGTRRALIAHPRTDDGQSIAGMLSELGFDSDTAQTGKQAIKLAHATPDYQFILISDAIDRPAVAELQQLLRRDPRTRNLPLGIMTRLDSARRMEYLAQTDPLTIAFPRLHSTQSLRIQSRRLLELAGRRRLTTDEGMLHAEFALQEIARLAGQPETYAFYDLMRHEASIRGALANSFLTDDATRALGLLATPNAQRTLLEVANQRARPLLDRQAASKAFETSIQLRGILLTRGEILAQYDRYNESATADVETQQVLGSLLDAIEAPTQSQPDADPGVVTEE